MTGPPKINNSLSHSQHNTFYSDSTIQVEYAWNAQITTYDSNCDCWFRLHNIYIYGYVWDTRPSKPEKPKQCFQEAMNAWSGLLQSASSIEMWMYSDIYIYALPETIPEVYQMLQIKSGFGSTLWPLLAIITNPPPPYSYIYVRKCAYKTIYVPGSNGRGLGILVDFIIETFLSPLSARPIMLCDCAHCAVKRSIVRTNILRVCSGTWTYYHPFACWSQHNIVSPLHTLAYIYIVYSIDPVEWEWETLCFVDIQRVFVYIYI